MLKDVVEAIKTSGEVENFYEGDFDEVRLYVRSPVDPLTRFEVVGRVYCVELKSRAMDRYVTGVSTTGFDEAARDAMDKLGAAEPVYNKPTV